MKDCPVVVEGLEGNPSPIHNPCARLVVLYRDEYVPDHLVALQVGQTDGIVIDAG